MDKTKFENLTVEELEDLLNERIEIVAPFIEEDIHSYLAFVDIIGIYNYLYNKEKSKNEHK